MRTSTLKPLAALLLTGAGAAFVLGFKTSDELGIETAAQPAGDATSSTTATGTTGTPSTSGTSPTGPAATASSGPAVTTNAAFADGTWTGKAISEPWGPFQVAVVISNGRIAAVKVVESPSDRRSSRINNQAVPLLTESVLASQGTSVDTVSGATWTSDSYASSLQSALDKASQAA